MKITVKTGAIQEEPAELIVVNLFKGVETPGGATGAVDKALGGAISALITDGDFRGKLNQTAVLYPAGAIPARRVLIVGLGEQEKFTLDHVRQAAAAAAKRTRELGVKSFGTIVHGGGRGGFDLADAAQAVVVGSLLGLYQFRELKTEPDEDAERQVDEMTVVVFGADNLPIVQAGAGAGEKIASAVCMARDLVNRPANFATPTVLAETARQVAAEFGLACQVLDEVEIAALGMGALLGVARGTDEPAKFIILEHNAGRDDLPTLVFVGKGITFDAGGISLKPSKDMHFMKADMGGSAAVMGALRAVGVLDLPLHVVGLMPATENLLGARAYKPGDVLRSLSGLTIEVQNTDAEGRLILADALAYAKRYNPDAVVDLATLTGACVVALGNHAAGLMGKDADLIARIKSAAEATGERVWQLPLFDEYGKQLESDVADINNIGGREGGACTAAYFLSKFATGYPWAHLDIAGVAWTNKHAEKPYLPKWATGAGVRLLTQLARDWAADGKEGK